MIQNQEHKKFYYIIGERIKNERVKAGYKQNDLAERLKISRASLINIEKGRQQPQLHFLYELSKILEKDIFEFIPKFDEIDFGTINQDFKKKIEQKSQGNDDTQKKLLEFINLIS